MTKNEALCLRCGFKWKTKHTSDNPYLENVQCSHCFGVSIVIVEQYRELLQHLRKLVSPEEVKKFLEFYDYVSKFGYIRNPKSRDAYLSINSTVTPEMLKQYLDEEMIEGGFLARWLLISGKPKPRPRGRLHEDVIRIYENLRHILTAIIGMEKHETFFVFGDEALGRYQAIEEEAYKRYDRVLPFVGRYLNYVVSFADILLVSDSLGMSVEKGISPYSYKQLKRLINLKSFIQLDNIHRTVKEKFSGESLSNLYSTINKSKPSNYLIVSREYVDRAWDMIEPCLKYALSIVDYVELDKPVARLREYMKQVKKSSRSRAMQYTHLNSKEMNIAVETLVHRAEMKIEREMVERRGSGKIPKTTFVWIGD